ncbi:MAG TPA: hypothetical protein VE866_03585 [Candidatus Binatia bacterium]|nr:hypothetical protein [Candidatus Binatia bacterium]
MTTTLIHLSVSVRWLLGMKKSQAKRVMKTLRTDGQPIQSLEQYRGILMDELAKGREFLPTSSDCDNHDWKTGCKGHDVDEAGNVTPRIQAQVTPISVGSAA